MNVTGLDHLVLTVTDPEASVAFYHGVLGMELVRFGQKRLALRVGDQKINLHVAGQEIKPCARRPAPRSTDLCLLVSTPLDQVRSELEAAGVPIELGPVPRTGARGPITSLYVRDPDGNLVELSHEVAG